jgi:hypothetical protein
MNLPCGRALADVISLHTWNCQTCITRKRSIEADAVMREEEAADALHPNGRCRCAGDGQCDWCVCTAERLATETEPVDVQVAVESDADFEKIEALLGALGFSVERVACGEPSP